MSFVQRLLVVGLAWTGVACTAAVSAAQEIDFNRDIKPLLSNRCFACHGPDDGHREAGLRLDTPAGATEDLGNYAAIVPGDPEASEAWLRITSDDPDTVMPPPSLGKALSPAEKRLLKRWIESGAKYEKHWSYVAPERPEVDVVAGDWIQNPVDAFVLAQLQDAGLEPMPRADRYQLIRRLAIDLTGLPPTPEEADRFAADRSPTAVDDLIARLLANPAAAERWTALWLDLARYADSAGYADDPPRTIWAYRDYVIDAFAGNMPFDQFTVEQLAGDLLPAADARQRQRLQVATAFHRNTMTNSEGGTDDEEFRTAAVVDRVNTTFAVWMGTTMACAQCHNHKYDPITQQEYFQVYAILNNTADADRRDEAPTVPVYDAGMLDRRLELQAKIKALQAELKSADLPRTEAQATWEEQLIATPAAARTVRIELPGKNAFLSLAEVEVLVNGKNVAPSGTASQSSTAYNGPAPLAIDGNREGDFEAGSVTHTGRDKTAWWQVTWDQDQPITAIRVFHRQGLHQRSHGLTVRVLDAQGNPWFTKTLDQVDPVSDDVVVSDANGGLRLLAGKAIQQRSDAEARELAVAFRETRLRKLESQLAAIKPKTTVPVLASRDQPRETHIQIRGDFRSPGDRVSAGLPQAFHDRTTEASPDRIDLARWLVDRRNPLTARVTVNRLWEQIFGRGLVATGEEFGAQGELPSHPKLLDFLAVELVESGWNLRHVLRLIVGSATYQQSSDATDQALALDPDNQLLSRGPRLRVGAEVVRDQALAASGLLSRRMYGPSVQPPRPKLNLKAAFGGSTDWKNSPGGDRYRRAVYTEWRRSMPYPSMATFDVPSREVCVVSRGATNTPLQALVTLNDPVYIEAAQALARQALQRSPAPRERLQWMFRRCVIRPPSDAELDRLQALLEEANSWFATRPEDAVKMATEPLGPVPPELANPQQAAAYTVVGNVLLNLDETLQKR